MADKIDRGRFGVRMKKIAGMMRDVPSASQMENIYDALVDLKFDTGDFDIACDYIIANNRRFPYVADFVEALQKETG